MHIESDRALIPTHISAVRHLTVTITAPPRKGPVRERPAVSVALVLDRSGSMAGRKIAMARTAVAHAIQLLDARDHLAVVVYDDRIKTILEPTAASKAAKKQALERLAAVEARGSTDLAGGWFQGIAHARGPEGHAGGPEAQRTNSEPGPTKVLLLTDGLANVGITDHDELRAEATKFREQGITTSTFGVGADFDEDLLSSMATHGGGHFYFIEKPEQIPDFLASELGETLEVVAANAVFDVTCGPGVEAKVLNDVPAETSDGRVRVRLGDLVADQEITLALKITCAPRAPEQSAFVDCRVTDRDAALFQEPMRVEWRAADAAADNRQPVNQAVLVVVAEVLAQRARAMALAANRRGDFEEAGRVLRDMIEQLPGLAPGNQQILAISDRLRQLEVEVAAQMDPVTLKAAHYEAYTRSHSRDASGRARRRTRT